MLRTAAGKRLQDRLFGQAVAGSPIAAGTTKREERERIYGTLESGMEAHHGDDNGTGRRQNAPVRFSPNPESPAWQPQLDDK